MKKANCGSDSTFSRRGTRGLWIAAAGLTFLVALAAPPPAAAADCPDADEDGFVSCGDCEVPSGKECGDCDDGDAAVNPDAKETCNDVDDDCDDKVDEGFLGCFFASFASPAPVEAAADPPPPCPDGDGDGYVACVGGCDSSGKTCGECDDGDPAINPGAAELCGDGVDNDCDPATDFDPMIGMDCAAAGNPDPDTGPCFSRGIYQCTMDLLDIECIQCSDDGMGGCVVNGDEVPVLFEQEGDPVDPANRTFDPTCTDLIDNDCDAPADPMGGPTFIDREDPDCTLLSEVLCDGLDDDQNGEVDEGFALGDECMVGQGFCERTGVLVCDPGDPLGTTCNASPGNPVAESGPRCSDGVDNDCDGSADLADPDCQSPEVCDGADNDGDSDIDEDFPDLGAACDNGLQGACLAPGTRVCAANGQGTVCNAPAVAAASESQAAGTCADGIDNDCDGSTDEADPSCAAVELAASCSLPFIVGSPGDDCNGKHEIHFDFAANEDVDVTAELLALDPDGNVIASLPVAHGDSAHLASRLDPSDFHVSTKTNKRGTRHTVFAPVPMLRITVKEKDGPNVAQAFCSNIPYLDVVEPSGNVVSVSEGDLTRVIAGIPFVDTTTLSVRVDGVDVLAELGIDPAVAFPGPGVFGPFGGVVTIDGKLVEVSDLLVQTAGSFGELSPNTLTMTLENLGGGGHIVLVEGDPLLAQPPVDDPTVECLVDDLKDAGTVAVFGIEILSPTPGEITPLVPTPVLGMVSHGRSIEGAMLNGAGLDVSGQVFTPGDGETSADEYVLLIDELVARTDLAADLNNAAGLGTFDAGSNRLIATATDDQGNRASESFLFAVANPEDLVQTSLAAATAEAGPQIQDALGAAAAQAVAETLAANGTEIENALVLGLEEVALDTFFQATCDAAKALAQQKITEALKAIDFPSKKLSVTLACDPTVRTSVTSVLLDGALTCDIGLEPANDKLVLTLTTPAIKVNASAYGYCKTELDLLLGKVCLSEVIVDVSAQATIPPFDVAFDIPEAVFTTGGVDITGTLTPPGEPAVAILSGGVEVNCLSGAVFDFVEFIVTIFTFGQVDLDLTPTFDNVFKEVDLRDKIGIQEFVIQVKEVKLNEEVVADSGKTLDVTLDAVDVKAGGLLLTFKATFAPTSVDPEVEDAPGALLTPAPAPMPPAPGAGNTYFVVADDLFNQLFASMTTQGEFRTICIDSGKTLSDLAPADCDGLGNAILRGACKALKGNDCSALPLAEKPSCVPIRNRLGNFNIDPMLDGFLFCARQDVPPRILIQDLANTPPVETHLRLNDLFVSVVVDRDGTMDLSDALSSLPKCFQQGSDTTGDCNLVGACLDLNLETSLLLETTGGKLRLVPGAPKVQVLARDEGAVCAGGINFGDSGVLGEASASDPIADLENNVEMLTPPLQSDGLNLGGIVLFANPRLIAIETDPVPDEFQDYIGITGDIVDVP